MLSRKAKKLNSSGQVASEYIIVAVSVFIFAALFSIPLKDNMNVFELMTEGLTRLVLKFTIILNMPF